MVDCGRPRFAAVFCSGSSDRGAMNERSFSKTVRTPANVALERQTSSTISHMKAMQSAKIRELRPALVDAGVLTLDQQTESLGLGRSTAWAILQGNHKSSGLSAATIKRMLTSQQLPPPARKILLEYVEEKLAGAYGHGKWRLRQFRARLANGQSFDAANPAWPIKTGPLRPSDPALTTCTERKPNQRLWFRWRITA